MKKNKHLLLGTVTLLLVATCSSVGAQEETSVNETTTENQMNTNANLTYFSDRDLNPAYDEVTANITLLGNTATIEGEGIVLENSVLKITQEGVYEFSGSSKGLQILVEATDTAKI